MVTVTIRTLAAVEVEVELSGVWNTGEPDVGIPPHYAIDTRKVVGCTLVQEAEFFDEEADDIQDAATEAFRKEVGDG